ncbi:MAG: amidophosphoribosyltransferase [Alphaproteobacteria bacterium]|nr:amidophosphoribosyltransferase [Alphaproteobacteria bacterium]
MRSLLKVRAYARGAKAALDLLFPPQCMACRAPVRDSGFCAACWGSIAFLDGPGCACCGLPFAVALEGENLCAACLARPPAFDSARAILAYDDASKGAILALKHADRLDLVPGFSRWLARAGRAGIDDCDLIVPVPLHRARLWRRRYNQAAELARRLARDLRLPADNQALARSRATPSQGAMPSAKARRRNVQRAFQVPDPAKVAGKRILLLDDVLTTGATAEACARALKRAGAAKVHVLALARVVKASDMLI